MALTDMSLSKEEAKEENGIGYETPKYPYGLSLCLNDDAIEKLGMKTLPAIGTEMQLMATVKVTGVRAYETNDGGSDAEQSVDLQITAMELAGGETKQSSMLDKANSLYGE